MAFARVTALALAAAGLVGVRGQADVLQPPPDMACDNGPKAAAWQAAKNSFRGVLQGEGSALQLAPRKAMIAAMDSAMKALKDADALAPGSSECGLGRLSLQLLSFASIEDPLALVQLFQAMEQLTSPVLTTLLDYSYARIGQSGWPIFGLLSQINLRKNEVAGAMNSDELDGLDEQAGTDLLANIITALSSGDPTVMEPAGSIYLAQETKGSALAPLTAIAARAYGSQDAQIRDEILRALQNGMRQVVSQPMELDIAMSTNWPLWGLIHLAADGYY